MSYRHDIAGVSDDNFRRGSNSNSSVLGDNVRISCSTGGAGPLQVTDPLLDHSIAIVDTTISTCGMNLSGYSTSCSRPLNILLTFSTLIFMPEGSTANLIFQIRRSMNSGPAIRIGPAFTFADEAESLKSESFSFQYFDSNLQPGVYTYTVELSSNSDISGVSGLTIVNASFCTLAIC